MSSTPFLEAVQAAFDCSAVHVDGAEEKALHKPGPEGLHVLLESCRSDAQSGNVSAGAISTETLRTVFEDKGWPVDFSPTWEDVTALLESFTNSAAAEEEEEGVSGDLRSGGGRG